TAECCSGYTEDGWFQRRDLAVPKVDGSVGHLDVGREDAHHLAILNPARQVHQASTFGVKPFAGFDVVAYGSAHRHIRLQLLSIKFWISAANVEEIRSRQFRIADWRELDDFSACAFEYHSIRVIVERKCRITG